MSQYGSQAGFIEALCLSLVLGYRDDSRSHFLSSLYVIQTSDGAALAGNLNISFGYWYSINITFGIYDRALHHWFRVSISDPTGPERDQNNLTDTELTFVGRTGSTELHKRLYIHT